MRMLLSSLILWPVIQYSQRKEGLPYPRGKLLWGCQIHSVWWWGVISNLGEEMSLTWSLLMLTLWSIFTSALHSWMVIVILLLSDSYFQSFQNSIVLTAFIWFSLLMRLVMSRLDDEFFFLNHDTKISKVAPDCWKKLATSTFTLFLRVKFFADDVSYIL